MKDLAARFNALLNGLQGLEDKPDMAIGVSGGADSMCLALLAGEWAKDSDAKIVALTVDHSLRQESAEEAIWVGGEMARLGISHHILAWTEDKPKSGIMAAARDARYRLMEKWCEENGVLHLIVAHNLGDQVETYEMRRHRGLEEFALACMSSISERGFGRIIRPLLGVSRGEIEEYLTQSGCAWINDPTNQKADYERNRVRMDLAGKAPEYAISISHKQQSAAKARTKLEESVASFAARHVRIYPEGYAEIIEKESLGVCTETAARTMSRLLAVISGSIEQVRTKEIKSLLADIKFRREHKGRTLGGCLVSWDDGKIIVTRELAAIEDEIEALGRNAYVWDGRFRVKNGEKPGKIGALGYAGLKMLEISDDFTSKAPRRALASMPARKMLEEADLAHHIDETESSFKPRLCLSPATFYV